MAALHAACFATPRPWSAAEFAALAADPAVLIRSSVNGAAMIVARKAGPEAEILTICVAPDARRNGAGASLLQTALDALRMDGVADVFLEVAADNIAAIALYDRAGFAVAGRRRGYYRPVGGDPVDALVLVRKL